MIGLCQSLVLPQSLVHKSMVTNLVHWVRDRKVTQQRMIDRSKRTEGREPEPTTLYHRNCISIPELYCPHQYIYTFPLLLKQFVLVSSLTVWNIFTGKRSSVSCLLLPALNWPYISFLVSLSLICVPALALSPCSMAQHLPKMWLILEHGKIWWSSFLRPP